MESDLISRSALRRSLEMRNMIELYPEWRTLSLGMKEKIGRLAGTFRKAIDSAPAINAGPVVRCRDCKYRCTYRCPMYHTETCLDDLDGFDDYNVDRTDNDGFCHLGARMDGEADE